MIRQYAINICGIRSEDLEQYRRLLPPDRLERIGRFRFDADRVRSLLGEVMVRVLIRELYGHDADQIVIRNDEHGRPYAQGLYPGLDFNISHAGSYVVCGIGDGRVGIDVEQIRDKDVAALARHVFSEEERREWEQLAGEEKIREFYRVWTVKESYVKYLGLGLGHAFESFASRKETDGWTRIPEEDRCILYSQLLDERHYLTVCTEDKKREALVLKPEFLMLRDKKLVKKSTCTEKK